MKENELVQEKMVNWYRPRMLLSIAMKAVISGTFGNYADRREVEAAIDTSLDNNQEWHSLKEDYCTKDEIWIDVINDTGDGFNSTYAIAKSVAQAKLEFTYTEKDGSNKKVTTERGRILVFGGDEVYPFPTRDAYENRFKFPFASALTKEECKLIKEEDRPHLYAIPGNHDWYDGLGNFIKVFCQQRPIGIWDTKQHRSYFALPLSHNYWIWATDIQLNSDIDAPQLAYFRSISEKMEDGDKVILLTAEPSWVYNEIFKKDISNDRLDFFIRDYIYNDCKGRSFKLAAVLTGDLHHYARYCNVDHLNGRQYIIAGGGGSFLHLTHNLPPELNKDPTNKLNRISTFPDAKKSKNLLLNNFLFPVKNRFFAFLIGCIYSFSFWFFNSVEIAAFRNLSGSGYSLPNVLTASCHKLLESPGVFIFAFSIGAGFFAFTDVKGNKPLRARFIGTAHALLQVIIYFIVAYSAGFFALHNHFKWFIFLPIIFLICLVGGAFSSLLMGIYLYLSNLIFNMHITEASSSLACPDYKNFLRLKINKMGVTIYPIGIMKVPKNWSRKDNGDGETCTFTGQNVQTFLIENPIEIYESQLI